MPPEEIPASDAPQAAPESPSPTAESPAPAAEPTMPPQEASPATTAPEPAPTPAEAAPAPETAHIPPDEPFEPTQTGPQGPLPFSTTDDRQENQVAQIPPNEPIPVQPELIQPPSAAAPVQTGILHTARDLLIKARISIQDRKRKKRDKIMLALNSKNKITNDEVEKLLHVSDATATRYLSALEKEGRIRQAGKTGAGVTYTKT